MPKNKLSAVLFDFDGTLTVPGLLDFPKIRAALRCPDNETILEYINSLPDAERREANRILEEFEMEAAQQAVPNARAIEVLNFLKSKQIPFGIITRNRYSMVLRSLEKFEGIRREDFAVILSRDDSYAPKPDPEGIQVAAARMGVPVEEVLVVGDFRYDIQAGERAGAITALLTNGDPDHGSGCSPDYRLSDLEEVEGLIRRLLPLPPGKLPNELLGPLLSGLRSTDPSLLIGPDVGQDAAAALLPADQDVLVLKSDPITFTVDELGYYAVVVNANDLVAAGAVPRWFLATLLMPPGSTAEQAGDHLQTMDQTCRQLGISLCGGHTEITPAVNQPVVSGCLAGTVARTALLRKENASEGDRVLLTKGVSVEGTSILAREFASELARLGVPEDRLEKCRRFLFDPGISVVTEGRLAIETGSVVGMHDVTEGGLATALEELSLACRHRVRVRTDRIPVFPETRDLCALIGLDPLGLIGSGSLIIICPSGRTGDLEAKIREAGIAVCEIGEVGEPGTGVEATDQNGKRVPWPRFEADEITRVETQLASRKSRPRGESVD
ncbi:MAG: HAD-IA family hydrolase [Acidobacteriota bacterium]